MSDFIDALLFGMTAATIAAFFLLLRHQWVRADKWETFRQERKDLVMARLIFEHKSGSKL